MWNHWHWRTTKHLNLKIYSTANGEISSSADLNVSNWIQIRSKSLGSWLSSVTMGTTGWDHLFKTVNIWTWSTAEEYVGISMRKAGTVLQVRELHGFIFYELRAAHFTVPFRDSYLFWCFRDTHNWKRYRRRAVWRGEDIAMCFVFELWFIFIQCFWIYTSKIVLCNEIVYKDSFKLFMMMLPSCRRQTCIVSSNSELKLDQANFKCSSAWVTGEQPVSHLLCTYKCEHQGLRDHLYYGCT